MEQIDVKILDRDYRLAVTAETRPRLLEAVRIVDEKMRTVRDGGRVSGVDRIAVMAALQLAHDLLLTREPTEESSSAALIERVRKLRSDVETELEADRARQHPLF